MAFLERKKIISSMLAVVMVGFNTLPSFALRYNKFDNINIDMPSVIAIDENSGDVLYGQNEDEQRPIASLTKSMTLLLILDAMESGKIKRDDVITLDKDPDSWGSSFYLKKGDSYTVDEFMQMIMIISANDACVVMAEYLEGNIDKFVEKMNDRAKGLGMTKTKFFNPNGLPLSREANADPGNLSTAKDLAVLVKYIMNVYGDEVKDLVSSKQLTVSNSDGVRYNSNKLLMRQDTFDGYIVDGFKTGYTDEAGFCLITTSEHNNNTPDDTSDDFRVVGVSLGGKNSEARFKSHTELLNYVQKSYTNQKILSADDVVDTLDKYHSDKYKIGIVPKKDLFVLTSNDAKLEYTQKIKINDNLSYPIKKGDSVGLLELTNKLDPNMKYTVGLVSSNSTEEVSLLDRIFKGIK